MNEGKESTVFKWAARIALPAALAVSSWFISTSIERSKLDSEYVKLAVSILSQSVDSNSRDAESQEALRGWAVRVLNDRSIVKMTKAEKAAFGNIHLDSMSFYLRPFSLEELKELSAMLDKLESLSPGKDPHPE